jgi:hypothetical protein
MIKEKGFNQADLARFAGIRPRKFAAQILCDMLAGRRRGEQWRAGVARVLGITEEEFWGDGPDTEASHEASICNT